MSFRNKPVLTISASLGTSIFLTGLPIGKALRLSIAAVAPAASPARWPNAVPR